MGVAVILYLLGYLIVAMYAEYRRPYSAFWKGYSDVTGFRFLGLNKDD